MLDHRFHWETTFRCRCTCLVNRYSQLWRPCNGQSSVTLVVFESVIITGSCAEAGRRPTVQPEKGVKIRNAFPQAQIIVVEVAIH